jgi:hypothetical protein
MQQILALIARRYFSEGLWLSRQLQPVRDIVLRLTMTLLVKAVDRVSSGSHNRQKVL